MKKVVSLILITALLLFGAIIVYANNGSENSPSDWAAEYVDKASEMNILNKSENSIEYKKYINREEYCELAYNTLEEAGKLGNEASVDELIFDDTSNKKVDGLNKIGIIKGKGNGKFAPNDGLTREEAATILWRMAEYIGFGGKDEADESFIEGVVYKDDADISTWAYDAVYGLLKMGIMEGTNNGFEPKGKYTGEQAVTTMVRMMENINLNNSDDLSDKYFADKINSMISDDSNYMFSPISIKMALALAANGAEGDTQKEILNAIGVENLDDFNENVQALIKKYSQSELLKLNIANSIWINRSQTDQSFSKSYSDKVKKYYNAESGNVTDDTAIKEINNWVKNKTNEKIDKILNDDNKDFWALIVNAVYFKAKWEDEFDSYLTAKDDFIDKNGRTSKIDFMNKTNWLNYSKNNGVEVVELPYKNYEVVRGSAGEYEVKDLKNMDVSMYLMMSDKDFDPEKTLEKADFDNTYVKLSMPKFKFEYSMSLNNILRQLGINIAFTDSAQFEPMFDGGSMFITDSVHKTYISVDEEGTEAAAVTAIACEGSSLPPEPISVKFNKPFTFVIKDNVNNEILFMGEYLFAE